MQPLKRQAEVGEEPRSRGGLEREQPAAGRHCKASSPSIDAWRWARCIADRKLRPPLEVNLCFRALAVRPAVTTKWYSRCATHPLSLPTAQPLQRAQTTVRTTVQDRWPEGWPDPTPNWCRFGCEAAKCEGRQSALTMYAFNSSTQSGTGFEDVSENERNAKNVNLEPAAHLWSTMPAAHSNL